MNHEIIIQAGPACDITFADLLSALDRLYDKSATRRDYGYAIKKCVEVYNCSRLEDIPANLTKFERQFSALGFVPTMPFTSDGAYKSWRRKVLASLRMYHGITDVKKALCTTKDEWASLLAVAAVVVKKLDIPSQRLIPMKILATECRKIGVRPLDLNRDLFLDITSRLKDGRLKSLRLVASLIKSLHMGSEDIRSMTPSPSIFILSKAKKKTEPPIHLSMEASDWVHDHCCGEIDTVNDEPGTRHSENTRLVHLAAFTKFLSTAMELDLLNDVVNLSTALQESIFRAVLRSWLRPEDITRSISDQTALQYVRTLKMFAGEHCVDTDYIKKFIKNTRQLKEGKKSNLEISEKPRAFCSWLLSDRKAQLTFLSLHVRFYNRSNALLETKKYRNLSVREHQELRQTGGLAAVAAILLWFAPLRIDNLVNITLFGVHPWLFMPNGKRDRAILLIPKEETKNKKPIRKKLERNKSRALEILEWYIHEIRPLHPCAATSPYLFPGYGKEHKPLTGDTVRKALSRYCRSIGFYALLPHWFRHGIASIFLKSNPGAYAHVARLLDDTPTTVRLYYAFIDEERLVEEAQQEWLKLAGFKEDIPPLKQVGGNSL